MRRVIIFVVLAIGFLSSAMAEKIVIGTSETLNSKVLNESRKILVSLPQDYDKSGYAYPVLYLTDGQSHFELMVSSVNFLVKSNIIPPMIIVGIDTSANRVRDLTPEVFDEEEKSHPWFKSVNYGGASKFLAFIKQELVPHIDKKYRTADFKVFSGHSFGGLFSFYSYLNAPNLFDGYMAISPSLGWDKERLVISAKTMIEQDTLSKQKIFLSKGNEVGTTGASYKSVIGLFESNKKYPMTSKEFPEEGHLTVVFDAQYHGLKALFKSWALPYKESAKGIDAVSAHSKKVKETFKIDFTSERWLINLGNSEYYKKNYDNAIRVFQRNLSIFPESAYSYFMLARVYEGKAEFKKSYKYYQQANEMVSSSEPNKSVYEEAVKKAKEQLEAL
ncbi:MAG: alpha/beta hydrolase-fold protein [Colwellia sp.]